MLITMQVAKEESSTDKDWTWALYQPYSMKWLYTFLTACGFINGAYLD